MADTYEKDLAQKTSLTTSDFIRVVGSDNVSYKQLVPDVADKVLTLGKSASTVGTISDIDAVIPFTTGYATFTASVSPTGAQSAFWYSMIGWGTGARAEITCVDVSGTVYTRVKDYSGWKAWVKQPTRAEVDALNNRFINSTSTQTIIETILTFPTGTPCTVRFSGEASSTLTGSNAQIGGTAYKADTSVVDMFVCGYGSSTVYSIRVTKQSVGNYTVARKSVALS